jgi:Tol biopolymer transport system component
MRRWAALCLLLPRHGANASHPEVHVKKLWLIVGALPAAAACTDRTAVPVAEVAAGAADEAANVVTRRVWSGAGVSLEGRPSPDGSLLSFVDWSTGNLAVRELASGADRPVTGKPSWEESASFSEWSVFSPDGEQLAFTWFADDWSYELRVAPAAGGQPRVIFRDDDVEYVRPWAWSPDGRTILAALVRRDRSIHFAAIPSQGGPTRTIRSFDWRGPRGVDLSPDGRFMVFDLPRSEVLHRDLHVVALESGQEWPLVSHPSESFVLGWAPDGGRVLFASDRGGTTGIWSIPVRNGRAAGEPTLVQPDVWRILPVGFADDGRYFYGVNTGNREVYSVSLDLRTGQPLSPPAPLRGDAVPGPAAAWSPEGRYLASTERVAGAGTALVLRIHDTGGHRVRDLPTEFSRIVDVVWSADAGSLFVYAHDARRRRGIFRVDLASGAVSPVVSPTEARIFRALAQSPDGSALFYVRNTPEEGQGFAIFRHELASGRETLLHAPGAGRIASLMRLSPDGHWIAFGEHPSLHDRTAALRVMPAAGGPPREIHRTLEPILTELAWSPDGRFLVFGKRTGEAADDGIELWRIPAAGGQPVPLGISAPALRGLHFHPDGRRLLFTAGQNAWELWVLEGLAASAATARGNSTVP